MSRFGTESGSGAGGPVLQARIRKTIGLRISAENEAEGIDSAEHSETAYDWGRLAASLRTVFGEHGDHQTDQITRRRRSESRGLAARREIDDVGAGPVSGAGVVLDGVEWTVERREPHLGQVLLVAADGVR